MTKPVSMLLMTSNGVGMGHLARQLAVGLAAGPDVRVTLMSMSAALPDVADVGIGGEYCPGPDRDWIPTEIWPHYVSARIQALAAEVEADVVSFDGVAPYRGVTLAKRGMPETPFVWFRRGMWKHDRNAGQLWKSALFDMIIEPGDIGVGADQGATTKRNDAVKVPPLSLYEVVDPLPRSQAASALGLEPDSPTVLLTLGTGRLGNVTSPGRRILEALVRQTTWQIAVLTSAIAESVIPLVDSDRVVEIRGVFPLVRYLSAFDFAVSAAGYNSVHEFIPAGIPTLLYPNPDTRTDDQVARATEVARHGYAIVAGRSIEDDVDRLVTLSGSDGFPSPPSLGGAEKTAEKLSQLASNFTSGPASLSQRLSAVRDDAKDALKRALGATGTNFVKRALRRPVARSGEKLAVTLDPHQPDARFLRFATDPTTRDLLHSGPVEHILPGSSNSYRAQRELIVHEFYDVIMKT